MNVSNLPALSTAAADSDGAGDSVLGVASASQSGGAFDCLPRPPVRLRIKVLAAGAALLAIIALAILFPQPALRIAGHSILVTKPNREIVFKTVDEQQQIRFKLSNITLRDIHVVGADSTCGCVATGDIPMTIPAGSAKDLVFRVSSAKDYIDNPATRRVQLFVDVPSPPLVLLFTLRTEPSSPTSNGS